MSAQSSEEDKKQTPHSSLSSSTASNPSNLAQNSDEKEEKASIQPDVLASSTKKRHFADYIRLLNHTIKQLDKWFTAWNATFPPNKATTTKFFETHKDLKSAVVNLQKLATSISLSIKQYSDQTNYSQLHIDIVIAIKLTDAQLQRSAAPEKLKTGWKVITDLYSLDLILSWGKNLETLCQQSLELAKQDKAIIENLREQNSTLTRQNVALSSKVTSNSDTLEAQRQTVDTQRETVTLLRQQLDALKKKQEEMEVEKKELQTRCETSEVKYRAIERELDESRQASRVGSRAQSRHGSPSHSRAPSGSSTPTHSHSDVKIDFSKVEMGLAKLAAKTASNAAPSDSATAPSPRHQGSETGSSTSREAGMFAVPAARRPSDSKLLQQNSRRASAPLPPPPKSPKFLDKLKMKLAPRLAQALMEYSEDPIAKKAIDILQAEIFFPFIPNYDEISAVIRGEKRGMIDTLLNLNVNADAKDAETINVWQTNTNLSHLAQELLSLITQASLEDKKPPSDDSEENRSLYAAHIESRLIKQDFLQFGNSKIVKEWFERWKQTVSANNSHKTKPLERGRSFSFNSRG